MLYHVTGPRVHTFLGHTDDVNALAVTRDDQGAQMHRQRLARYPRQGVERLQPAWTTFR